MLHEREVVRSYSMVAHTPLENMTTQSNLTPECQNTLSNLTKERSVKLLGFFENNRNKENEIILPDRGGEAFSWPTNKL